MNHYTTPQELIALHERLMNKNIEPGKTFYNLLDGMGYLKVALTAESKRTRQTAWLIVKQHWLWPLTFLSLLAIFWQAVFHFVGW